MRTINFVRERRKKLNKTQRKDKKIFQYSAGGLGVVIVASLIVIGLRFFLVSSFSLIERDIDSARSSIMSNETLEESFVVLIHKVKSIEKILLERRDKQEAIEFFSQIFGNEGVIEKMHYESTTAGRLLDFTVLSGNVFHLENVVEILDSDRVREKYPEINTSSLARSQNGTYSLHVTVVLNGQNNNNK